LLAARAIIQTELNRNRLSLPLLLHTKIRIEKTLTFLKTTRIVTRKWHLERKREEEERAKRDPFE
jgi:hypothetical protein